MKLLSRILILLVILQAGGLYFLNNFVHNAHQMVVLKEKKNNQHFSFSIKEYSKLRKEGKKEFLLGGLWYDIEKFAIVNNKLEIDAYPDKHEKKLKDSFKQHHKNDNQNTKTPIVKSIDGKCISLSALNKNEQVIKLKTTILPVIVETIYLELVSPPPKVV